MENTTKNDLTKKQLEENKKLIQIAEKILTEYKYAFEVLGNVDKI